MIPECLFVDDQRSSDVSGFDFYVPLQECGSCEAIPLSLSLWYFYLRSVWFRKKQIEKLESYSPDFRKNLGYLEVIKREDLPFYHQMQI